jgi:hypothetical protein
MSIDFFIKQRIEFAQCPIDETLPNFIKRKHPERERKANKVQGPESRQAKEPQSGEPPGGNGTSKY